MKIAASSLEFGTTQTKLPYQVLLPGDFPANELPYRTEGIWQALVLSKGRVSLQSTRVRLRQIPYPRVTGDSLIPGARIETGIRDSILFLVRSRNHKPLTLTATCYVGRGLLAPGASLPLRPLAGKSWSIHGSRERLHGELRTYVIRLEEAVTGRSQSLGEFETHTSPHIQWVGDLDGDQRPDFFSYDDSDESGSHEWGLFLSSLAVGKKLYEMAASFYEPGC